MIESLYCEYCDDQVPPELDNIWYVCPYCDVVLTSEFAPSK